jgi:hypothetical protein
MTDPHEEKKEVIIELLNKNAALREALKECRAWLDNSLGDLKEAGYSEKSWTVIQTKLLIAKATKLLK